MNQLSLIPNKACSYAHVIHRDLYRTEAVLKGSRKKVGGISRLEMLSPLNAEPSVRRKGARVKEEAGYSLSGPDWLIVINDMDLVSGRETGIAERLKARGCVRWRICGSQENYTELGFLSVQRGREGRQWTGPRTYRPQAHSLPHTIVQLIIFLCGNKDTCKS